MNKKYENDNLNKNITEEYEPKNAYSYRRVKVEQKKILSPKNDEQKEEPAEEKMITVEEIIKEKKVEEPGNHMRYKYKYKNRFRKEQEEQNNTEKENKDKKENNKFEENKEKEKEYINVTEDGGVKKRIIREGTGDKAVEGSEVKVNYIGKNSSNKIFDQTKDKPFTFKIGAHSVIKGWEVGVKTMKIGEKSEFIFSPDYAYGKQKVSELIPENSTLTFEI